MARKPKNEISQAAFVRQVLGTTPDATVAGVKEAWEKAGYKGELNQTIFYNERKKLGLSTGKPRKGAKRGRKPGSGKAADAPKAAAAPKAVGRPAGKAGYHEIERALDHLIVKADDLGDAHLADARRHARRRVSSHLGG